MSEDITAKLQRRGKAIWRMGLVEKDGNGSHSYIVYSPSLRGRQTKHRVAGDWTTASCSCLDWEANSEQRAYFCEHKYAVAYATGRMEEAED